MNRMIGLLRPSLALALLMAASIPTRATQGSTLPTFDVVSIHVHTPALYEGTKIISSPNDGSFRTVNLPLKAIIEFAFEMPQSRILNAPAWTSSQPFDIDARSGDALEQRLHDLSADQAKPIKLAMIQALLADRFGLKTHHEQRELPIYALVVATLPVIAQELTRDAGRVVVDKTGVSGRFDIDLRWQPDDAPPDPDANLPSLFTALQEQLGLRLESAKGPTDVLVIDDVHPPSSN
jgi:hypothetical protein